MFPVFLVYVLVGAACCAARSPLCCCLANHRTVVELMRVRGGSDEDDILFFFYSFDFHFRSVSSVLVAVCYLQHTPSLIYYYLVERPITAPD
uniref:Putative secreted protein n=1 Tax=Anopheles darlingi TaxID=43151 RepID=A0A2M4DRJ9_ANODA